MLLTARLAARIARPPRAQLHCCRVLGELSNYDPPTVHYLCCIIRRLCEIVVTHVVTSSWRGSTTKRSAWPRSRSGPTTALSAALRFARSLFRSLFLCLLSLCIMTESERE